MSERIRCKLCGEETIPNKQKVPKQGGFAGLTTEYRCTSCGGVLYIKDE